MPTSLRDPRAWMLVAVGLALTASCSSDPRTEGPRSIATEATEVTERDAPRVRPPVDLGSVVRNASLSFRAHPDHANAFAGGGATFESEVEGSAIRVTPRGSDRSARPPLAPARPPVADGRGTPLALETTLVARGETVLADRRRAASSMLERDGSIVLQRGDVAERIQNDDVGVEQSWRFDHVPSGRGDLVVRVRATGQPYVASTDHGLHFGSTGALGLRYGTATWIDATGARTVVRPRFVGGEIVMAVPDAIIAASQYPAVLDPTVAAEQEIDQPIAGSSAGGEQSGPSVASSGPGKGYLAVWYDKRGVRPAIYGARVATGGNVIDDTGIPIASSVGSTQPVVASNGTGYIVVWTVAYVDIYQGAGVYAVRLDADGKPLDAAPVPIVLNQTNARTPSAAFDGTNWLLAWQRYAGGTTQSDIFASRIGRTGPVVDATPATISKAAEAESAPVVVFDGTDFFVSWRTYNALYGQKFGKDLKAIGSRLPLSPGATDSIYEFDAIFDGTRHVVVWSHYDFMTFSTDILVRRFDKAGTPLDVGALPIEVDPSYDDRPRVVWDGTNSFVTWSRGVDLLGTRLDAAGKVIEATPVVLATSTSGFYDQAVASDGLGSLMVNGEFVSPNYDVTALKIAKPPVAGGKPVVLSKAANSQTDPAVAWNGGTHYAAWLDSRGAQPGIFGSRIAPSGQPQPPVGLVTAANYTQLTGPRIASDGAAFFVVFRANDSVAARTGIYGLYLDPTGQPDPIGPFVITPVNPSVFEYATPDVAFDGANYLVTWQQRGNEGRYIVAVRLPKGTTKPLEKEPVAVSPITVDEQRTNPSVAFDGTNYLIAWITSRATASNIQVSHVYGTRVSKEGAALDAEIPICDAFLLQRAPRVAGDRKKGGFFVVWEDFRTALETADVYGARISAGGENLDGTSGMQIAAGAHDESRPHVAYAGDASNWMVAWRDLRSKQTYDIYGAWVSLAGKNLDPSGYLLSAEGGDEEAPWVSAAGGGQMLLAYQRLDPRTGYGNYRLRARAINSGAGAAAACTKNEECASRSCIESVCCEADCGGCGVCNVTPGVCTPRAAGSETPRCERYKCKGALECPTTCENDGDCASNASCDPATKTCVSRVICSDDHTLKDLTGKQTECAPYKCRADACLAQCGSVDDCAGGFVCDYNGRCVQAPGPDDGGCAATGGASSSSSSNGALLAIAATMLAGVFARRRRR